MFKFEATLITLAIVIGTLILLLDKSGCTLPDIDPPAPMWMNTIYFLDHQQNCFARITVEGKMGITFIPKEACPIAQEKSNETFNYEKNFQYPRSSDMR